MALSETKLDDTVHHSLFNLPNFHAPYTKHRTRHGGGVAVYTRRHMSTRRLPELECAEEEWIWTKTKVKNETILTCALYLPPNLTHDRLERFIDNLNNSVTAAQRFPNAIIIILGDFNTGNIYLRNNAMHNGITTFDVKLNDTFESLGLTQLITTPTRYTDTSSNLRDLVVTNNPQIVAQSGLLPPFSQLDHIPIFVNLAIEKEPAIKQQERFIIWDYARTDIDKLISVLRQTDWDFIVHKNIDDATEQFTRTILTAAADAIPTKTIKTRQNDKIWMTPELKRQMRKRDRLFRQATQRQTQDAWLKWRMQRNKTTALNRQLKQKELQKHINKLVEHKKDPYMYHKTLKTLIGRTNSNIIPPIETDDHEIITDNMQKANLMNDYFVSQTKPDTSKLSLPIYHNDPSQNTEAVPALDEIQVTESQVLKILNSLDVNKSTGPDKMPTKLIKMIAILIVTPLTSLYNKSLKSGIFPKQWKEAQVTPIFKKNGSPSDVKQYRPISLLSCLSKILEKLVFSSIYSHISSKNLLSERQSGYRPHHSTEIQLTYLTHNIYKNLDEGRDVTAVYLDISKYFDKIWHDGLLHKCKNEFSISGTLLSWLKSYLTNRQQKARIGDNVSLTKTISSGCPQGSVLGPLLALMYLNGLTKEVTNDILLYADDTSIHASHDKHDIDAVRQSLQQDLDIIYRYGKQWAITFNASKTVQQTFTRKTEHVPLALTFSREVIPIVENHKHLGLTFSTDLRFHTHINIVLRKMNMALGPIYPIAKFLTRSTLSGLYTTYIRPYHDYGDVAFDGHITTHDEIRLERLQNRIARLTTGAPLKTSSNRLRQEVGWETLKSRREMHRLTLLKKIIHVPDIHPTYITSILPQPRIKSTNRSLRNAHTRTLPSNKTTSFQKSFIPNTIRKWNTISTSIDEKTSIPVFKRKIAELGCPGLPRLCTSHLEQSTVIVFTPKLEQEPYL